MLKNLFLFFIFFLYFFSYSLCDHCGEHNIVINKSILDERVKELYFASEDQQDIYILTEAGTIYRSVDRGDTWLNKMNLFPQWNNQSISYPLGKTGVHHIRGSGKDGVVYFEGHGLAYWVTRGQDEYKLYQLGTYDFNTEIITGEYLYKLAPHPTEASTVLRLLYNSTCFETNYVICNIRSEVSQFEGADNSWVLVDDYTFKAEWGIEADRVVLTTIPEGERDENQLGVPYLDERKQLYVSANYGRNSLALVPKVTDFEITNEVVYFIKYSAGEISAYITTDIYSANEMIFGGSGNYSGISFYLLETTQDVSFIGVQPSHDHPYGNLFQGSYVDAHYWISLENLRMNSYGAEFYKTKDLPGIYIVNQYDADYLDDEHVKTKITFDEGGIWTPLQVLNQEDNVNLFITKEYTDQKTLSSEQAVGIIYSLGNEGDYRRQTSDDVGLYLSRSGGLTWERVLDGLNYFSFNDHASLIMAISHDRTSTLNYSWDQGLNWDSCSWGDLSSDNFYAKKIYALSSYPNGLQFLVTGEFEQSGMVMSIDFMNNIPRLCNVTEDYEIFQPTYGPFCLLGEATSYLRRQRNASCVSVGFEQQDLGTYNCPCTRMDFQCDGECFQEQQVDGQLNTVCVNICEGQENDPTLPPEDCDSKYIQTQGYRKIPGDTCTGINTDYAPLLLDCPNLSESVSPTLSATPSSTPDLPETQSATPSATLDLLETQSATPSAIITSTIQSNITTQITSPTTILSSNSSTVIPNSETPSSSLIPKSDSQSPSPSPIKPEPTESSNYDSSGNESSGYESSGLYSSIEYSSDDTKKTENGFPLTLIIAGAAIFGIVGVMILLCIGVIIVVVRKKKSENRSSLKTKYDDDVFSLEDNDEWEL